MSSLLSLALSLALADGLADQVVAGTRTGLAMQDQAVPVEVLGRRQIEQNMLVAPGDIVRSLDAISGLRVQTTSPELGTAMVRIAGPAGPLHAGARRRRAALL